MDGHCQYWQARISSSIRYGRGHSGSLLCRTGAFTLLSSTVLLSNQWQWHDPPSKVKYIFLFSSVSEIKKRRPSFHCYKFCFFSRKFFLNLQKKKKREAAVASCELRDPSLFHNRQLRITWADFSTTVKSLNFEKKSSTSIEPPSLNCAESWSLKYAICAVFEIWLF